MSVRFSIQLFYALLSISLSAFSIGPDLRSKFTQYKMLSGTRFSPSDLVGTAFVFRSSLATLHSVMYIVHSIMYPGRYERNDIVVIVPRTKEFRYRRNKSI